MFTLTYNHQWDHYQKYVILALFYEESLIHEEFLYLFHKPSCLLNDAFASLYYLCFNEKETKT